MSTESVVDEVRARLASERAHEERPENFGDFEKAEEHGLELADLNVIANRHFYAGRHEGADEGYDRGMNAGIASGRSRQRVEDVAVSRAVTATITGRLSRIYGELAPVPDDTEARDRRTKSELRDRALTLVSELRAGIAVLAVKVERGEFDDGE